MVFNRRKFNLPKFPPDVAPTFQQLCDMLDVDIVKGFVSGVDERLQALTDKSKENPRINLPLAKLLADRCKYLIEHYEEFSPSQKSKAVGAIRYFALADDPLSEDSFACGLEDDAKVMNYVLEELGVDNHFIEY